jgi:hypothetical protein
MSRYGSLSASDVLFPIGDCSDVPDLADSPPTPKLDCAAGRGSKESAKESAPSSDASASPPETEAAAKFAPVEYTDAAGAGVREAAEMGGTGEVADALKDEEGIAVFAADLIREELAEEEVLALTGVSTLTVRVDEIRVAGGRLEAPMTGTEEEGFFSLTSLMRSEREISEALNLLMVVL